MVTDGIEFSLMSANLQADIDAANYGKIEGRHSLTQYNSYLEIKGRGLHNSQIVDFFAIVLANSRQWQFEDVPLGFILSGPNELLTPTVWQMTNDPF